MSVSWGNWTTYKHALRVLEERMAVLSHLPRPAICLYKYTFGKWYVCIEFCLLFQIILVHANLFSGNNCWGWQNDQMLKTNGIKSVSNCFLGVRHCNFPRKFVNRFSSTFFSSYRRVAKKNDTDLKAIWSK